jgi:DNA-binding NarL/FixJ family response regulator
VAVLHNAAAEIELGAGKLRVLIIDDHLLFADLLAMALASEDDFDCVGTAATVSAALDCVARVAPDIVIMDVRLGHENGFDAVRQVRALGKGAVIVVLSTHYDPNRVVSAAQAGANAFVPKTGSLTELLSVVRGTRSDSVPVPSSVYRESAMPQSEHREVVQKLSSREHEVLSLMGEGLAPSAIARFLDISVHTSRGYVKSIHTKLGARSQLEAIVKAQRLGLIALVPAA